MLVYSLLSSMSSNFLISFSICHQMLCFKLEHRLLFRKVALNGGSDRTPPFSEHMFLFYPTSSIVLPSSYLPSPFYSYFLFKHFTLFPFSSSLPTCIHHLFYFIVNSCFHSFTIDFSLFASPPLKWPSSFFKICSEMSMSVAVCVGGGKAEEIFSVFFQFHISPFQ